MTEASHIEGDAGMVPDVGDDMSHLIRNDSALSKRRPVAIVEVGAADQVKIDLGVYDSANSPKGFVLDYEPTIEPATAIVSKLVAARVNKAGMYQLVLFFANYGDKPVTATVWEL